MGRISPTSRIVAFVSLVAVLTAGGAALGASAGKRRHRGLTAARVLADQSKSPVRVIVLLRNQHVNLPPSSGRVQARAAALHSDQGPLRSLVTRSGGRITHTYRTVNAFAATISRAERARLAANPAVAKVLADVFVPRPDPSTGRAGSAGIGNPGAAGAGAAASGSGSASGGQQICPADPAKPIVEPEALSIIHATEAQQLVSGSGVKVAFVADGLDTNNPDFIRPNGEHVFVDYRDFTAEGPNALTGGAEAFGDASSIAAQGRVVHDLSHYVNPKHPLPSGCNVVVRGVAPGASLVGVKVFGNASGAFTSVILQGMDWAVSVDHVDVLNESFGADNIPDTEQDVTKQFNRLAVAAGVTVTVSSGDQGTANTIGAPASDPSAIDTGGTTQFRHFAQTDRGGYQLSPHGWVNENIAEFSSGGFTQGGRTVDLVAPGNESYETCTANPVIYSECTNLAGQPSDIRYFGGTSESAPLTAGVAALVIQAYREHHGGASPSAGLVKQLIDSNANDLNIPSTEQGAGELDALSAVRAAASFQTGAPTGNGRLVSPGQLDLSAPPGASTGSDLKLTNLGARAETINAELRTLRIPLSENHGHVSLDTAADPTFFDHRGVSQSYRKLTFTVPAHADRLDASLAYPAPPSTVNLTLFDPAGRFTAFTYHPAGGNANFSHIDVRNPPAGTWTAVFFTPTGPTGFSGAVHYDFAASRFGPIGTVTPSSVTLPPGASASLHVALSAPGTPGDYSRDLELSGSSGKTTVVPVVMRSLVPLAGGRGSFAGTITGGNGNGFVGREDTFAFDVPGGAAALGVQMSLPGDPGTQLLGYLVSPDGQTLGQEASAQSPNGTEKLQMFQRQPRPGRWKFVIITANPVGGTTTAARFTGSVSLAAPPVHAVGVPNSASTVLRAGHPVTGRVTVSNPGNTYMHVFIDPRRSHRTFYSLLALNQATGVTLPLSGIALPPEWVVPTETDVLVAAAEGSSPITFDWGFGDPDLEGHSFGNNAVGTISAPELTPGVWFMAPALVGPFSGPASGTVNTGLAAHARVFDPSVSSPTGDPQLADIEPTAPPANPIAVAPGATVTIPVTITPAGAKGSVVSGDLFVDDNQGGTGSANELAAITYRYRIG